MFQKTTMLPVAVWHFVNVCVLVKWSVNNKIPNIILVMDKKPQKDIKYIQQLFVFHALLLCHLLEFNLCFLHSAPPFTLVVLAVIGPASTHLRHINLLPWVFLLSLLLLFYPSEVFSPLLFWPLACLSIFMIFFVYVIAWIPCQSV